MSIHDSVVPARVRSVLEPVDRLDASGFAAGLAEDARMTMGGGEPLIGRAAIEEAVGEFFATLANIEHEIIAVWDMRSEMITELNVTYYLADGRQVSVPSVTIWRLNADGEISDYRVFVDRSQMLTTSA